MKKTPPRHPNGLPIKSKSAKSRKKTRSEKHVEKHGAQSTAPDVPQDPLHPSKRWFRLHETIVLTFPPVPPKWQKIVPLGTPLEAFCRTKFVKRRSKGSSKDMKKIYAKFHASRCLNGFQNDLQKGLAPAPVLCFWASRCHCRLRWVPICQKAFQITKKRL